jgi:thioredoxin 1
MALLTLNDDNFQTDVLQSDVPVLVDFYAEWCGPCKQLAPVIEEIARSFGGRIKVGKVDVDQAQKTAMQYGIMGVPTVMIFKGGKAVDQIVGRVPKETLEDKINRALG